MAKFTAHGRTSESLNADKHCDCESQQAAEAWIASNGPFQSAWVEDNETQEILESPAERGMSSEDRVRDLDRFLSKYC